MLQAKPREIASANVRIYKSTRNKFKELSHKTGKTIARLIDESYYLAKWK